MDVNIGKLIAAINPDIYCKKDEIEDESGKKVVRAKLVKEIAKKEGYLKAMDKADLIDMDIMDYENIIYSDAFKFAGQKNPLEKHKLQYEASDQLLETIYFWLIDNLIIDYKKNPPIKIIDNFIATPGSSYHTEWTSKAQQAQQQAMSMLGAANQVVKSILSLVYDLKEFELRLEPYKSLKPENKNEKAKEAATLTLKQVWLDQVDIKRGNTSIKALAISGGGPGQGGPNFVTLLDGFMSVKNEADVERIDLNEVVKKILMQRVAEFNKWVIESERELSNRFKIEKNYLKSQVSNLKLYTRWIKPYLKTAQEMEQRGKSTAALVNIFNVAMFDLVLFAHEKYEISEWITRGAIPKFFKDYEKMKKRISYPILIIELTFRGVPEKVGGHHRYKGRVDMTFTSFTLNDQEIKILKDEIEKANTDDAMSYIESATTGSLGIIKEDLDRYIQEGEEKKEEKEEKKSDENPFSALFSSLTDLFKSKKTEKKKEEDKEIKPDDDYEKAQRSTAIIESRVKCRDFYDKYKKANGMRTL